MICLTTNKNQNVSIKASTLSTVLQEKIVENIFTIQINQTKNKEGGGAFTLPHDFCEEFYTITEYDKKQLDSLYEVVSLTQNEKINTVAQILSPTPQGRRKNTPDPHPRDRMCPPAAVGWPGR